MESKILCADMKLKPCPRCGGEYVYVGEERFRGINIYKYYYTVSCAECGAKVVGAAKSYGGGSINYVGEAAKEAKKMWNDGKRREDYAKNNPLTE